MSSEYIPHPIDTSKVELSPELMELTEKLSKNTHERWSEGRMSEGWQFGEKRDDEKKLHPCLIPYEMLSESEKNFDRVTSLETIKLLITLGYTVGRADTERWAKLKAEIRDAAYGPAGVVTQLRDGRPGPAEPIGSTLIELCKKLHALIREQGFATSDQYSFASALVYELMKFAAREPWVADFGEILTDALITE